MGQYEIQVKGIVRSEGKYLILKKWYDDRVIDPYRWQFVDGISEFAEDPAKAVVRLIKEQTGIDAVMDNPLYTWTCMIGDKQIIGICYGCFALQSEVILSEEFQEFEWIKKEEFADYIDNEKVLHDLNNCNLQEGIV